MWVWFTLAVLGTLVPACPLLDDPVAKNTVDDTWSPPPSDALLALTLPNHVAIVWSDCNDKGDSKTYALTDDATRVSLCTAPSSVFLLALSSTPGTGYSWLPDRSFVSSPLVRFLRCDYNTQLSESGWVGGSTTEQWWFMAPAALGNYSISLVYARSWERTDPAADRTPLTVNVRVA